MKNLIVSGAGGPIKRRCNGERYLALEMETLSPMDGYQSSHVPWQQSVSARDTGGLKSRFMGSAELPIRDGIANRPQVGSSASSTIQIAEHDTIVSRRRLRTGIILSSPALL
jgi:hypothetical protein